MNDSLFALRTLQVALKMPACLVSFGSLRLVRSVSISRPPDGRIALEITALQLFWSQGMNHAHMRERHKTQLFC